MGSFTVNLTRKFGLELGFSGHGGNDGKIATFMGGPRYKFRGERVSPFVHFLVGIHSWRPEGIPSDNNLGIAAGGGLDIHASKRIDVRLIQADWVWANHDLLPAAGYTNPSGVRISGGIVFNFMAGPPPPPPSCSVSTQPMEVFAGEPVRATANTANFKPGRTLSYSWTATGGKVTGSDMGASVDTAGLAPGSYNVSVQVADGKKGMANCSGQFTVKEPPRNPPVLSCSANPATVRSGESSTISCNCTSPDGRSLSYSWNASAGQLAPTDGTATLDTAGLGSGPVSVNTTCTDDRGLSTAATTYVNVEVPPPPPQPSMIGECEFKTARVDNQCKAILDDVALRMQREADARAVIIGYAGARESKRVAAQRATNAKKYLTAEKGIDPSRIDVMTGTEEGKRAAFYLVPAGATFSMPGTEMVMGK
jgi:hypothetical protein